MKQRQKSNDIDDNKKSATADGPVNQNFMKSYKKERQTVDSLTLNSKIQHNAKPYSGIVCSMLAILGALNSSIGNFLCLAFNFQFRILSHSRGWVEEKVLMIRIVSHQVRTSRRKNTFYQQPAKLFCFSLLLSAPRLELIKSQKSSRERKYVELVECFVEQIAFSRSRRAQRRASNESAEIWLWFFFFDLSSPHLSFDRSPIAIDFMFFFLGRIFVYGIYILMEY